MVKVVNVVEDVARVGRRTRSPKHPFHIRHLPWQIQPFCIAPVVPGETLKSALLQSRAITDPIKNPLIGWWLEHYLFYVRLTDLEDGTIEPEGRFTNMLIDPAVTLAAANLSAQPSKTGFYHLSASNTYDFVRACTYSVVHHYFRDEDEAHPTAGANEIDSIPLARATMPGREGWMQSMQQDTTEANPDELLRGENPDDPSVSSTYQEAYDRMRQMGATDLTYEDFLRAFGIKGLTVKRPNRPELLRYLRAWQYPSTHVDPTGGATNTVVSWAVQETVNKDRFFKEPGFIFGVSCARPKIYLSKQGNTAAGLMEGALAWLPATLRNRPELGLKKIAAAVGPLAGNTGGLDYWIDVRDLFMYGDQFVNVDLASTDAGLVALPAFTAGAPNTLTKKDMLYVTATMIEGLFSSTAGAGVRAGRQVKQDGALDLHIATAEADPT